MTSPLLAPVALDAPPERGDTLRHDPTFERWDAAACEARDLANQAVRVLNGLGLHLPALPEGSLRDLLVVPLTGDPVAIRRCADSCHVVDAALADVAGNHVRLAAWTDLRWGGAAAGGYLLALGARAVALRGLGLAIGRGARVLDEIADAAERLQVEVEGLVVELGEVLARLLRKVAQRIAGPAGWGAFALEIAQRGFEAVTDVVDDVRRGLELVERLLTLHDEVADWAALQRDRLDAVVGLHELLTAS